MVKFMMAAVFAACFAVPALAGDCGGCKGGGCGDKFAKADKDGDGKISRDEFWGDDAMFAKLDADADGFVTADELKAAMPKGGPGKGKGMPAGKAGRGGGCKGGGCKGGGCGK